jgi:phage major head subunit gpT-like protein
MVNPNVNISQFAAAGEKAVEKEFFSIYTKDYWTVKDFGSLFRIKPSDGKSEDYGFGGPMPTPVKVSSISDYPRFGFDDEKYTLTNENYGFIVEVDENVMDDDRAGYVRDRAQSAAIGFDIWIGEQFADLVVNGTSTTCHDGQYYFDTDHASSQSNADQNKEVSVTNIDDAVTNILSVVNAMCKFKDKNGKYLNKYPTHVVAGTGDTADAWEMVLNTPLWPGTANNTGNPFYNISSATAWYMFDASGWKPFIYQERTALKIYTTIPDGNLAQFVWRLKKRCAFGYGPWWTGIKGDA